MRHVRLTPKQERGEDAYEIFADGREALLADLGAAVGVFLANLEW